MNAQTRGLKDAADLEVSGASVRSLELLEQGTRELRYFIDDPVATTEAALADSPALVMGHVLKGWLHLLGTEPGAVPVARNAWETGTRLPANERERMHLQALGQLVQGQWRDAGRTLEDLSIAYPRDGLALQVGHQIDFFTGDSRMLRDRIARALPAWGEQLPGYHSVRAMLAFGLEETGDYARAEQIGRHSVEREPRDAWAQHAVAHVLEMQDRRAEGIEWMRAGPQAWSQGNFFAVHNWWHLALFHLGRDEIDEVLALVDGPICASASPVILDMVDASALLWRLFLRGIPTGNRWEALADRWAPVAAGGNYAFNDMHAMMAMVGAGRTKEADGVLEAQAAALEQPGDNASFVREVGRAATRAIRAFGDGDYASTVHLLRPIRHHAHRFGGSHAQRDVIDLTLLEAATRAGMQPLVTALQAERRVARAG